jgi:predicted MFS family arabinose efflux permease
VHSELTTSALLTGFVLAWGANDFQIGLLGAIPFLGQMGQLAGAYLVDRSAARRRETVALLGFLARGTWFLTAILPFLVSGHPRLVMPAILLVFTFYQLAYSASGPGWVAWMAVLVPPRLRGRYLGRRNRVMEAVAVTAALAAGWAIDAFRAAGHERLGFAALQAMAGAAGIACFVLLRRQPDPGHSSRPAQISLSYLLRPLADVRFRWLTAFNVCWCFGLNAGFPFLSAHLLKDLQWDFKRLAVLGVLGSLAAVIMSPLWGRWADSHGYKAVLRWCAVGMLQLPLCYAFCPRQADWPIYLSNFLHGVFLSGFNLALFSLTLCTLPANASTMGAALFRALTAPATFLAGALSGLLAQHLAGTRASVGGGVLWELPNTVPAFSRSAGPGFCLASPARGYQGGFDQRSRVLIRAGFAPSSRRFGHRRRAGNQPAIEHHVHLSSGRFDNAPQQAPHRRSADVLERPVNCR